jgi:hypothetical protein
MGTYLKIAPQNSDVSFTSVGAGAVTATSGSFTTASGYFSGTFSGSFIGLPTSSVDGHNFTTPFYVTASKGYLSFVDNASFTMVSTGSVSHLFLIQDVTGSVFKINSQGVTELKIFTGSAPTPVTGGIYFTSTDMYIGIQESIL